MCLYHVPTRLNRNREYIKHQRDLSLPPGIYQIYTPAGVFDVWLKQDINNNTMIGAVILLLGHLYILATLS